MDMNIDELRHKAEAFDMIADDLAALHSAAERYRFAKAGERLIPAALAEIERLYKDLNQVIDANSALWKRVPRSTGAGAKPCLLKLINPDGVMHNTRLVDAETGEDITARLAVRAVDLRIDASRTLSGEIAIGKTIWRTKHPFTQSYEDVRALEFADGTRVEFDADSGKPRFAQIPAGADAIAAQLEALYDRGDTNEALDEPSDVPAVLRHGESVLPQEPALVEVAAVTFDPPAPFETRPAAPDFAAITAAVVG